MKSYLKQLRINLKREIDSACFELVDIYSMKVEVTDKQTIEVKGEYEDQKMDSSLIKSLNRLGKKLIADGWDLDTDVFIRMNTFHERSREGEEEQGRYVLSDSTKSFNKFLTKLNEIPKKRMFIRSRPNPLINISIATILITFKLR